MPGITKHLKALQALATPGPMAALPLLARVRWTAVTSDKVLNVPSCHHPSVPPSVLHSSSLEHPGQPSAGTGEGCGAGGSLLTPQHHCSSLPSWAQTWAIPGAPRKIWYTTFLLQFWTKLSCPRGAAGQHRAGDSPGARAPSTKLARSSAAGEPGRAAHHTPTPFLLSIVHTVSAFQIKIHSNHQSQAGSNPPAAMSQET